MMYKDPSNKWSKKSKNPSALFASLILAISAFIFPIVTLNASIFGEPFSMSAITLIQLAIDLFSKSILFNSQENITAFLMVVIYFIIVFMYLLNGFGIIYNKYSRYASYLTIGFLFLGLFYISLMSMKVGAQGFISLFANLSPGIGIWIAPVIGILYLVLKRWINSMIHL